MRCFIAFELPASAVQRCVDCQNVWKEEGIEGRYSSRENLHLTLAFCGELNEEQIKKVKEIFSGSCFEKISVQTRGLVRFGQVAALSLCNNSKLLQVVDRLRTELKQTQIPFEDRPFKAHITLLRKPKIPENRTLPAPQPFCFELSRMVFYSPTLRPQGPIYTPLAEINAD